MEPPGREPGTDRDRFRKVEEKLGGLAARAVIDFDMIADGDRILVAVSGGKDSYALLRLLKRMRSIAPVKFDLVAFHLKHNLFDYALEQVEGPLRELGIPFVFIQQDIVSILEDKLRPGTTRCSLCSRLRRGIIYGQSDALGCNKIALGHHRDDMVHTFLMNILFTGQVKTMAAHLLSDDGKHRVIRPLAYCRQDLISEYARCCGFQGLPQGTCGVVDPKREAIGKLAEELSARFPRSANSMFAALKNVRLTHLLDPELARSGRGQREETSPACRLAENDEEGST